MSIQISELTRGSIKWHQSDAAYRYFMYIYHPGIITDNKIRKRSIWTGDPEDAQVPNWWTSI